MQAFVEEIGFVFVETVVDYFELKRSARGCTGEEGAYSPVNLSASLVFGVDLFVPPVKAHAEKRKEEDQAGDDSQHVATRSIAVNFGANDHYLRLIYL